MANKATKVLYDIRDAIKKLTKLDKKVKDTGKKTKKGFKEASTGVEEFDNKIDDLRGRLDGMKGKLTAARAGLGTVGVAFGVAAGAAIAATVAVLDFNNALRDGDKASGDYVAGARKVREVFDALSASQDATRAHEFLLAKEAIALQREDLTNKQIASDKTKELANEAVSTEKGKLRSIESALRASHSKTLSAEKRLAEKRKELAGDSNEFGGQAKGRRVVSLAAKASQLAKGGKVDEAEALIEKAKELSTELGDHVFFTDKIKSANNDVVKALEKNVKEAKKDEGSLKNKLEKQRNVVSQVEAEAKKQKEISKSLSNQIKQLGVKSGLIGVQRKLEKQLTKTDQTARTVTSEQEGLKGEIISDANTTAFVRGVQRISDVVSSFKSPLTLAGSAGDRGQAQDIESRVQALSVKAADPSLTKQQAEDLAPELGQLTEEIQKFRSEIKAGTKSGSAERPLARSDPKLDAILGILKAFEGGGAIGQNENIQAAQLRQREKADVAQEQAQAISNVTINNTITGGLDAEALKKLEAQQRRIARQEVSKAAK